MNRVSPFLFLLALLFTASATAAPKIATINAVQISREYKRFQADVKTYEAAKEKLEASPVKLAAIEMGKKLEKQAEVLRNTPSDDENRGKLVKEAEETKVAFNDLTNQWTKLRIPTLREITEEFVENSQKRNEEILKEAARIGEEMGFDWVLETTGTTNSKMPTVLYVRDATDITDKVIEALNKISPEESGEGQPDE